MFQLKVNRTHLIIRILQGFFSLVLAAGLTLSEARAAELTGPVETGTYIYINEDVTIDDVTVSCKPALQAPPGAVRGIRVVVYGGDIHVVGSINAAGADGLDGEDGNHDTHPTAGGTGQRGCDVILETWPPPSHVSGPLDDWSVSIGDEIHVDLSGGDGGDGGDGASDHLDDCSPHDAQHGATAGQGGAAGNFTVLASGTVSVGSPVLAQGGRGGNGGSGGHGGVAGHGGLAREGRNGGRGGKITIRHTAVAPADAALSIVANANTLAGGLSSSGGDGGRGGAGGGNPGAKNGGNGGPGGAGNDIVIAVNHFGINGIDNVPASVTADGGKGGLGGSGGDGGDTDCAECDDLEWTIQAGDGGKGGLGGHGGDGGAVDVTVAEDASLAHGGIGSDGGHGSPAGESGISGTAIAGACDGDEIDCPSDFFPFAGTIGSAAGHGGAAGAITVQAENLTVNPSAGVSASGGHGGDAVDGGTPGLYCCCEDPPGQGAHAGAGSQGGPGGRGGPGADIALVAVAANFSDDDFETCGGNGKDGGDGTWGNPVGPGGVGGDGGASGDLTLNGMILPNDCQPLNGVDGQQGDNDDKPDCVCP